MSDTNTRNWTAGNLYFYGNEIVVTGKGTIFVFWSCSDFMHSHLTSARLRVDIPGNLIVTAVGVEINAMDISYLVQRQYRRLLSVSSLSLVFLHWIRNYLWIFAETEVRPLIMDVDNSFSSGCGTRQASTSPLITLLSSTENQLKQNRQIDGTKQKTIKTNRSNNQ